MWHEIRSYTCLSCALLLTEVCEDVRVEPPLQQLTGESLQHHATRGIEVRLDICDRRF